jgi:hypothetical protein
MNLDWEEVDCSMNRAKVPGGWLVHLYEERWNAERTAWYPILVGGYFVPDPTHAWGKKEDECEVST